MGEPHDLIVEYLRRWDIWDIKTILRGKAYGASDDEILRILVPSGELSIEFLQNLVRKPSVGEVVAALKGTVYYNVIKDIEYGRVFDEGRGRTRQVLLRKDGRRIANYWLLTVPKSCSDGDRRS